MNTIISRDFYASGFKTFGDGRSLGMNLELEVCFSQKHYDEGGGRGKIVLPNAAHEEVLNLQKIMSASAVVPECSLVITADVLTVRAELEALRKRVAELEKML